MSIIPTSPPLAAPPIPVMLEHWPGVYNQVGANSAWSEGDGLAGGGETPFAMWNRATSGGILGRMWTAAGVHGGVLGASAVFADQDQIEEYARSLPHIMIQAGGAHGPVPESRRVLSVTIMMLLTKHTADVAPAAWGHRTGIFFRARRSGVTFWVGGAADPDRHGFGIVGDNAGGWMWASHTDDGASSAFDETVALTWPVAINKLCRVDVVMISATASRLASVECWVGGKKLVEREWTATGGSTVLPSIVANVSGGWFFALGGEGSTFAESILCVPVVEVRRGCIHPVSGQTFNGL